MREKPINAADELIGHRLSHYQVVEVAGRGGMGIVYRAVDTRLQRTVALKVLSPNRNAAQGSKRRLYKEARAASAITHPNVAHIYEIGETDGLSFIAMEFIEGETLDRVLQAELHNGKPLPESTIIAIGSQVAWALEAAHAKGIVHRDIKPGNIVIAPSGHVKVLDFGLAKLTSDAADEEVAATVTRTGVILGTVQYMSPEQALGKPVDARTDIFAFGVVLYEMITGALPFRGETATQIISNILQGEPEPISTVSNAVTPELERIVLRCLEKDKELRYRSAGDLALDLCALRHTRETTNGTVRVRAWLRIPRRSWLRAAFVVGAGAAGYLAIQRFTGDTTLDTLAVLPLLNLSGDPNLEYLADGITDSLINRLSALSSLKVRPRSSVYRYKDAYQKGTLNLPATGAELKVKAILTGRIFRDSGAIVVSAELTDIENDRQVWGEQFRQTMSSIFFVQDEVARQLASQLNIRATAEEQARLRRRNTESSEAQHLYLKGRYLWNRRTEENLRKAIDYFNQAIETDPRFALAYAGSADCYMMLGNVVHPQEVFPRSKAAANKAIQLDPSAAEPYATLGYVALHYDWDWAQAETSFRTALRLNPNYPTAHSMYARYLSVIGRTDEALAEMRKALDLDPLALGISTGIGLCYYLARRYDEAVEQHKRTIEIEPRFALAHFNLGRVYTQKGMYRQAIAEFQIGLKESASDAGAQSELAYAYARSGQADEARRVLQMVTAFSAKRYVPPYFHALVHAGLSETDDAIQELERAYNDRSSPMVFLKTDPQWDPLRKDARFDSLLQRMRLA